MHHNSFSTYFFKPIQINQNIEKGKAFITYWRSKLLRFGYNVEKENSLVPNREASSQTHQHVYQNHKNHQSKQHQLRFWNQNLEWVTLWKVEKGERVYHLKKWVSNSRESRNKLSWSENQASFIWFGLRRNERVRQLLIGEDIRNEEYASLTWFIFWTWSRLYRINNMVVPVPHEFRPHTWHYNRLLWYHLIHLIYIS